MGQPRVLKRLGATGVVTKKAYCIKPLRYQYELTYKGRDLAPVLEAMAEWAIKYVPGVKLFSRHREKELV
jgi:DNA-binding HxlR family transcriptional regulator